MYTSLTLSLDIRCTGGTGSKLSLFTGGHWKGLSPYPKWLSWDETVESLIGTGKAMGNGNHVPICFFIARAESSLRKWFGAVGVRGNCFAGCTGALALWRSRSQRQQGVETLHFLLRNCRQCRVFPNAFFFSLNFRHDKTS